MTPVEFHWNSAGTVERFFSGNLMFLEKHKTTFIIDIQNSETL